VLESGQRKAQAAAEPRQALEALPVMAFFAIAGKAEATRGAGCWSWTIRKVEAPMKLT